MGESLPSTSKKPSLKEQIRAINEKIWFYDSQIDISVQHDGSMVRTIRKKRPYAIFIALFLIVGLFIASCFFVRSDNFNFTWEGLNNILHELYVLNPDSYRSLRTTDKWWEYMWTTAVPVIWQTTEMCFIATVFGALLSIPIYYLSAHNVAQHAYVYQPVRIVSDLVRTIPTMTFAIFATLIVGQGSLAGIVAMVIFTIGIMYQLMYEYIETLEMSPFEAARSSGGGKLQSVHLGLHPEIKPMFFANFLYTFEINIRASIILGYVGAGGYGYELNERITAEQYDRVGCLLVPLFILVFTLQVASNIVSRKMK
jgi:phosphonate transport system permease protein